MSFVDLLDFIQLPEELAVLEHFNRLGLLAVQKEVARRRLYSFSFLLLQKRPLII